MEDAPPMFGYRWFAMDALNEEMHILYFHSTRIYKPNYLIYSYSDDQGKTWELDTIDGSADTLGHVRHLYSLATFNAALSVDQCGRPHIFYTVNHFHQHENKPSWAIHVEKIDGKWRRDTVDSQGGEDLMINFDVDMVIGPDGQPRIVYIHGESEPMFGMRAEGKWQVEPVQGIGDPRYLWNNIALDSKGDPHILLGKFTSQEYAVKKNGRWDVSPIFSNVNGIGDIVMDAGNGPHITFNSPRDMSFRHATLEGGKWKRGLIESIPWEGSANGKRARLKRDSSGILHAVYYGHNDFHSNGYIVYATSPDNGRSWREEIVEDVGGIYVESSYPDLVITDKLIGLFYKGKEDIPRFAWKRQNKPALRRIKWTDCDGDQDQRQHDVQWREEPVPGM